MKFTVAVERITPAKADKWLNELNTNNRKLRENVAEKYAEDMKNGNWTECGAPIIFYEDGSLADGQHRLFAISLSAVATEFIVVRNFSRKAGLNIDMGLIRTLVDNAHISGADSELSNQLLGLCRSVEMGRPTSSRELLTSTQRLEMVDKHRDAANWVLTNGPRGRSLNNAMVNAAIGRAWYYEADAERLLHFCQVFSSGHVVDPDRDSAAVSLRTYFLTKPALGTTANWTDTFLKAQNAISYFMRGRRLTVIKGVKEEAYPAFKKRVPKKTA